MPQCAPIPLRFQYRDHDGRGELFQTRARRNARTWLERARSLQLRRAGCQRNTQASKSLGAQESSQSRSHSHRVAYFPRFRCIRQDTLPDRQGEIRVSGHSTAVISTSRARTAAASQVNPQTLTQGARESPNAPHERRRHSRWNLALYRSRGARCGC